MQPLTNDLSDKVAKAIFVAHRKPVVEAERLFINIAEQVEGFNRNIGTVDSALQGGSRSSQFRWYEPDRRRSFSVVDYLMVVILQPFVVGRCSSVKTWNPLLRFPNDLYQSLTRLTTLALTLRDAARAWTTVSNDIATFRPEHAFRAILVHVARLAADEGFIDLNFAANFRP